MRERDPPFGHHDHEVSVTELEAEIPTHTENDDFTVECRPLKRSSMLSIRVRALKKRLRSEYAPLQTFAPEPPISPR
jgi:hypothetical protein